MIRLIMGGLVIAMALPLASSGVARTAATTAGEDARSLPMHFAWHREGPAEACGEQCRTWISAVGAITADTPRQFEVFADREDVRGKILVLDSGGGSVLAALSLGRLIRRYDMTTTIGNTIELSEQENEDARVTISPKADCESMCAFVLLAGTRRFVPPEARVLVHQIWLGDRRNDAAAATYTAEDVVTIQRDVGKLVLYTAEMGGGPELIEIALRIPPWERMRALTQEELRRVRLQTVDHLFEQTPANSTISSAPSGPESILATPINERGWSVLEKSGQTLLARNHPLTIEGEEIGTFDILFGCTAKSDQYAVTYVERRKHLIGGRIPDALKDVTVSVGQNSTPLKVVSSRPIDKPMGRTSFARGVIPAAMVESLAAAGNHSLTVATVTRDNADTAIRVGNSGVAKIYPKLAAACAK